MLRKPDNQEQATWPPSTAAIERGAALPVGHAVRADATTVPPAPTSQVRDNVLEQSEQSFPASDAPSWTGVSI
jgi:hypothetical protein